MPIPVQTCWIESKSTLFAIDVLQDDYAAEIFKLWFEGTAPDDVTWDEETRPDWAQYMRAEPGLQQKIQKALEEHAEGLRDTVQMAAGPGPVTVARTFRLPPFHVFVGHGHGGYKIGYNVLNGSNANAGALPDRTKDGDFLISGRFTAVRPAGPETGYTVAYEDLEFVFNDIIDINKKWGSDVWLGGFASSMGECLGTAPKDYCLHIKWRALVPIYIKVLPWPSEAYLRKRGM